jgi:phospholipid N-methyltransferase
MKHTQDYRYQNISGAGRNCDDRWDIISKYVKGNQNTLSIDVGSAEGVFSKRIVEKTGGKVVSIEGSDFVYNEQLNYCANEINSHNIQLHKTALNRDTLSVFG